MKAQFKSIFIKNINLWIIKKNTKIVVLWPFF